MSEADVLNRARIRESHSTTANGVDLSNVKTVKECFSSDQWDDTLTSVDTEKYSYDAFIKAVARFPAFCGGMTAECKLELAFVFGHMTQETGCGQWDSTFHFHTELPESAGDSEYRSTTCGPSCDVYPPKEGKKYIGRGSKQISWNYNYGMYSAIMEGDKNTLLDNPEKILEADHIITSGLWFYMTPQSPKPSMHDIVLGCWTPDSSSSLKLNKRFAWTTKVINGAQECSASRAETDLRHKTRFDYFTEWAEYFGLDDMDAYNADDFEFTDCKDLEGYGSTISDMKLNWQKDTTLTSANGNCGCELTTNATPYPRYRFDSDDTHPTGGLSFCETSVCGDFDGTIESSKCRTGEQTWGTCTESFYAGSARCGTSWGDANSACTFRCAENDHCDGSKVCWCGLVNQCSTLRRILEQEQV